MSKKDLRARTEPNNYRTGKRILDRLGMSMQDAIEGWWLRLIHDGGEAEAAAADYHRAKADVAALERREERLGERIEQLREEREGVRSELDEARATVEEAEDALVDAAASEGGRDPETEIEEVAYDLLVKVAHDEIGTNGVTEGTTEVREAARRVQSSPDEMIEAMRRVASPIDAEMGTHADPLHRGFLTSDDNVQERYRSPEDFIPVRRAIARVVLDDEDVDWDRVPQSKADELLG